MSERGIVKLGDYGLTEHVEHTSKRMKSADSLLYTAPEEFVGKGEMKSEVWSLGVTLAELAEGKNLYCFTAGNIYEKGPVIAYIDLMYSREGLDSKGIISDLQGPVLMTPSTAQNAEYFTTVVNFDYRIHPNWNLYLKGAYETAGIYKTNGPFEKGLYRTTWNVQACVEYFPMRKSELLIFAHLLYKGHHLTRRAQALGGMSPDTQRISIGLVYSIPVF